jgi:hypothetical protein
MFEDRIQLSDQAAEKIRQLRQAQRNDPRIVVSTATAAIACDYGETKVRELTEVGEFSSIVDGKLRRIFMASVYDHLVRRIIATYPAGGPPLKSPAGRFKPGPKAPGRPRKGEIAIESETAAETA